MSSLSHPCVYIDESGTGKDEPFFGIGFLKVDNPYPISSALLKPHTKLKSFKAARRLEIKREIKEEERSVKPEELDIMMLSTRHAEYHFTDLRQENLNDYLELLDAISPFQFHFCALMVNKKDDKFDQEVYKNYWDYSISFMKTLCKNNLKAHEKASIVIDSMTRPKVATKELDQELLSLSTVGNVQMVDSVGVLLMQICDLFLGSVAFQNRLAVGWVTAQKRIDDKSQFSESLCKIIGCQNPKEFLGNKTYISGNKYFSVWHLKMD